MKSTPLLIKIQYPITLQEKKHRYEGINFCGIFFVAITIDRATSV